MNTIIKSFRSGLLIGTALILLLAACHKDKTKPCLNGGYSFIVTSEWSTQKQIYNVGESLRLHSNFPKTLTDQINTSMLVDYSNSVGINGEITIYELDTTNHQVIDAANKFNYNITKGTISTSTTKPLRIKDFFYDELSSSYDFDLTVVPTTKGIYAIYVSDLISNGTQGNDCTNAGFENTLTNTDKNIDLFEYALNHPPASQYEIDRVYCFRVQ